MKDQETKHTPTPLKIGNTLNLVGFDFDGRDWLTRIYANGKTVFIAVGSTEKESAEHAAFIVKACNSYEDMLEFLQTEEKFLRSLYEQGTLSEPNHIKWNNLKALIDKATPPVS